MPNSSTVYGYLRNTLAEETDQIFLRTIHDMIVGITGLANTNVRPRYQPLPVGIPSGDWIAFGIQELSDDYEASTKVNPDGLTSTYTANQAVKMLFTFYGDNCEKNYIALQRGLTVGQNRAELRLKGVVYRNAETLFNRYENVNNTFIKRADVFFNFDRKITNTYNIASLLSSSNFNTIIN